MKKLRNASFIVLMVLMVIIAGCSNGDNASTANGSKGSKGTENSDKDLTIAVSADVASFDVHNHQATQTQAIHVNMFDSLIEKNRDGEFVPDLADSWKNIDELTWEFTLNPKAKFHNGDPVTSNDVKFSLERAATDTSLLENKYFKQIKEVKVIDDHTFQVITNGPDPVLLNRVSRQGSGILPAKYIEENGWEHFLKNPVGAGPYKFVEWKKDDRIVLEKFAEYHKYDPKWEKVVFRIIPEDSTRVAELLTGGVDMAVNIPPSDWERVKNNEGTQMVSGPTHRIMQLVLRLTDGNATTDPRVREAIDLAIDKQLIIDTIYGGAGTPTRTGVTPYSFGGNEDLYGKSLFDPEKAKKLLKEAGYEKGLDLTLSVSNGRYLKDKESAELIQAMLAEVGVNVTLEPLEWSKFLENVSGKTFKEVYMVGFANSLGDASNPLGQVHPAITAGETDYKNPEVEKLLDEAMYNMNEEARAEQYKQVQEIVAEERPRVYLYTLDQFLGMSDKLTYETHIDEWYVVDDVEVVK
ncbi:ABC transporter substrate-binding protein [Bacillus sp. JJ1773]|uniref:ABC transporter substrate-binding protein n=1 Tax=Bacillus sp. JJ1773 TaxID=3122965 RepID=UPI0030007F66